MTPPRRLSDIAFHGGAVCYACDLDFERSLAEQPEYLDRHLAEVFYEAGFRLSVGYVDASGLSDGVYPGGEFQVSLRGQSGGLVVSDQRTRDLRQLRRLILQARDEAQKLRPESAIKLEATP